MISIAGIITFISLCLLMFFSPKKKILGRLLIMLIFFEIFTNVGVFAIIGNFEILNSDIVWIFLLGYAFLISLRSRFSIVDILFLLVLELALMASMYAEGYNNLSFNPRSILVSIRLLCAVLLCQFLYHHTRQQDYLKTVLRKGGIFCQKLYISLLLVEMMVKLMWQNNIWNVMIGKIFGESIYQVHWLIERGGMVALQGLCKEPSHLAIALFFSGMIDLLIYNGKNRICLYLFWINIVLLLISGSFSSILYVLALLFGYLFYVPISGYKIAGMFLLVLFGTSLFIFGEHISLIRYYLFRLEHVFSLYTGAIDISNSTSEGVRTLSLVHSLNAFTQNLLLGEGLGNNVGTGALPSLFAAGGLLVGGIYLANIFRYVRHNRHYIGIIVGLLIATCFTMDMGNLYSGTFVVLILLMNYPPAITEEQYA